MKKILILAVFGILVWGNLTMTKISFAEANDEELFRITLLCPTNDEVRMEFAQVIASELIKIGIDAELKYVDWDELMERTFNKNGKTYKKGGYDVSFFAWRIGEFDEGSIYYHFHSENAVDRGGNNVMSWKNSESDEMIDKIMETENQEELKQYWFTWQEIFYEEQPSIVIYYFYYEGEGKEYFFYQQMALNLNHPVLKDKIVRQAISHLVPRQKVANIFNAKKNYPNATNAKPAALPVDPKFWAYNENLKPYSYDPELAKELLFKAGYEIKTKKHELAQSYLDQAEEASIIDEDYQKAIELAQKAELIYEELGDSKRLKTTTSLILFYEGKGLFDSEDYSNAKSKFEEAKSLFDDLGNTENSQKAQLMIEKCDQEIQKQELRKEADSLFDQGKSEFENKKYEDAALHINQAKEKYQEIGDTDKVSECDEWLQKIESEEKKAGIGVWVFLIGFVLAIKILRRR